MYLGCYGNTKGVSAVTLKEVKRDKIYSHLVDDEGVVCETIQRHQVEEEHVSQQEEGHVMLVVTCVEHQDEEQDGGQVEQGGQDLEGEGVREIGSS